MEKTEAHRLPRVVLNERRRLAVKLRLNGATIAETVVQCELGRSALICAMLACPHFPHTNNTQLAAAVAVGKWETP